MDTAIPAVDPEAQAALRGMKPWIRITSVLGFIWSAGLAIGAAYMAFIGFLFGMTAPMGLTFLAGAACYVVMGLIGCFLSTLLHRSANSLGAVLENPSRENWVEFLRRKRILWVSIGIFAVLNFLLLLGGLALLLTAQLPRP
jgi:hypothetical protein